MALQCLLSDPNVTGLSKTVSEGLEIGCLTAHSAILWLFLVIVVR